jgi:hypothetical protein
MSYKHEMHAWEQLQLSMSELERVANLVAETQPIWSGHLKRVVEGIRDGYAGDAPRPEAQEPVAWVYLDREGNETITRQPPDRVNRPQDYTITPLYMNNGGTS